MSRIQLRRDTSANWSSNNPTLASGEVGVDTTNNLFKIGNGATAWNSLTASFTTTGVSDGDKGDITVSSSGTVWTIDNGVVSLAKLANMATGSLYYRKTAGSGAPEVQTLATLKTDLGLTGTNSGDQTITLTGDVTGSGTGSFAATIGNGVVTLAKIANAAASSKLLGSGATGIGSSYAEITLGTNLSMSGTTLNATSTVADGDKGDITVSSSGTVWTIDNSVVTLAKMADVATGSVFYRKTAGTGAPEVQTLATLKTDLGLTGTNSGDQTITLTGDVTGSGTGSFAATIASGAVSLAKMANVATGTVFYRKTAGTGAPEVQTLATLKTDLGLTGTNSGDQTSIVGISGTIAQFNTACSDADFATLAGTETLTNKRVTPRVSTTTSSATPTINTDNVDVYGLTAQAVDITSFTTNLSGTPTDGQRLWIYIVGTAARAITWGTSFEASTIALPTTTVSTNRLDVGFVWNAATSKWRCVGYV